MEHGDEEILATGNILSSVTNKSSGVGTVTNKANVYRLTAEREGIVTIHVGGGRNSNALHANTSSGEIDFQCTKGVFEIESISVGVGNHRELGERTIFSVLRSGEVEVIS